MAERLVRVRAAPISAAASLGMSEGHTEGMWADSACTHSATATMSAARPAWSKASWRARARSNTTMSKPDNPHRSTEASAAESAGPGGISASPSGSSTNDPRSIMCSNIAAGYDITPVNDKTRQARWPVTKREVPVSPPTRSSR
ncbi:MAG: hypothetical protein JWO67_6176 [Streptosporangiaceae bacterium]|nr:hypothetical protein [Streptosporangiaceae bacterium]